MTNSQLLSLLSKPHHCGILTGGNMLVSQRGYQQEHNDVDEHGYQQGHGGDECGNKNNLLTQGICRRSIQAA